MPNFRKEIYPEYKANRNKAKIEPAMVLVHPVPGGFVGRLASERTQVLFDSITVHSPHYDKFHALGLAEALKAVAKLRGYKVAACHVLCEDSHISHYTQHYQKNITYSYIKDNGTISPPSEYSQLIDGMLYRFSQVKCEECEGYGWFGSEEDPDDCPYCGGFGHTYSVAPEPSDNLMAQACSCGSMFLYKPESYQTSCPACRKFIHVYPSGCIVAI